MDVVSLAAKGVRLAISLTNPIPNGVKLTVFEVDPSGKGSCAAQKNDLTEALLDLLSSSQVAPLRCPSPSMLETLLPPASFASSLFHLDVHINDDPSCRVERTLTVCLPLMTHCWLEHGQGVFVHCKAGISRSPTIVCAFLLSLRRQLSVDRGVASRLVERIRKRELATPRDNKKLPLTATQPLGADSHVDVDHVHDVDAAAHTVDYVIMEVQRRRGCVMPNPGFRAQLIEFVATGCSPSWEN